jgi:uncharacterized metal-binding protein YceD (DUF177 family)
MKIYIATIPFTGMKIDAPISLDSLNARIKEGAETTQVAFIEPPMADITLTRTHGGVIVKGIISGRCSQDCSTCADAVTHDITAPIDWLLQTASNAAAPGDSIDDPGVLFYEGDHIDLEEPLQEALILTINPFWHPPREARDICSVCHRDCSRKAWQASGSETSTSFGQLLKGAIGDPKK